MARVSAVQLNILASSLPLLTMPVIARIYDPALYGGYTVLLSLATLACFVGTLRLDLGIIAATDTDSAAVLSCCVLAGVALSAVAWVALPMLAPSLARMGPSAQPGGISAALVLVLLLAAQIVTLALLVQQGRTMAVALVNLAYQVLFFVLAVAIAPRGALGNGLVEARLAGLVLAVGAAGALVALPLVVLRGIAARGRWPQVLAANRGYALFTFPYTVLGMLAADSLLYVLAYVGDPARAGQLALVRSLLLAPGSILAGAVSTLFFRSVIDAPSLEDTRRRTLEGALALGRVALPAFGLAAALAPQILGSVLGPAWRDGAPIFQLLALPFALTVLTGWPERAFEARGRQRTAFFLQGVAALATYLGLLVAAGLLGVRGHGLIAVFAAVHLCYQIVYAAAAFRLLGLSRSEIMRCLAEALGLFAIGVLVGLGIARALSGDLAIVTAAGGLLALYGIVRARPTLTAIADLGGPRARP